MPTFKPLPQRLAGRALALLPAWPWWRRERFHFSRDYRRLVRRLLADHPRDEAMSIAVGGGYEELGAKLLQVLVEGGLEDGMRLADIGCGSGRLAHVLATRVRLGSYLGIDVTPEVLAYARTRCPADYRFVLREDLRIPAADASLDMACAFSVFTHLLHEETWLYLEEVARVPASRAVRWCSRSWSSGRTACTGRDFERTARGIRSGVRGPLNVFIERPVIALWARRLGFHPPIFTASGEGVAGRSDRASPSCGFVDAGDRGAIRPEAR